MNWTKITGTLLLVFSPITCFPQSAVDTPPTLSASELCSRLLQTEDLTASLGLLKQNKTSITRFLWTRLISEAVKNSNDNNGARASLLLELAKGIADQLEDKVLLGHTYYRMGYLHFAQGDIKAAIDSYLRSKNIFEEAKATRDLVYVLSELGNLFTFTKDYISAEEYSEKSLALADSTKVSTPSVSGLPNDYGIAHAWSNLGEVSLWKGDYDQSLIRFQKALGLWEKLNRGGLIYRAHIINVLTDMGTAYRMLGLHAESLRSWYRALELAKTAEDKERSAAALVSIGLLYLEQRDYSKASDFLNRGLRLFIENKNERETASALINIGLLEQRLKNYDRAIETFAKALEKAEAISAPDLVVAAQEGLGVVYYELHKFETASEWFDNAWSLAEKTGDKIRMTELLWRKGQVFYAKGDYEKSSIKANDGANLATRLRSPLMTYLALTLLGKVQRTQGEHGAALESFTKAINAVEHMRDQIAGGEKEQQLFFEDKLSPYHEIVSELVKTNSTAEALNYAERAKGRVLLDVLRNGRIYRNKFLNQSEQAEERGLYSEMVSINTQIRVERMRPQPDDSRIEGLEARLKKARNTYEAFQAALFAAHPELEAKRGQFSPFTLQDAAVLLPDTRTAILEYVVTDDQTFLFVLSRNAAGQTNTVDVRVYSIKITRADLSNLIEKHRELLSTNHPGFRNTGRELYDLLVAPAEPYLHGRATVCIVPDGPLWNLPFQALQTASDKYLLELFALYYTPSLQVLREMKKRSDSLKALPVSKREGHQSSPLVARTTQQLYAIGNPSFGGEALARVRSLRNAPFVPLPETEREVQTLASAVYGPQASVVRIGTDAGEEAVKAEMGKYRVLHFATHGVLDNQNPLYSYIVLAPSIDSNEDGLLEAWELMEMDLRAELAVLSACDTARGRIGDGEGMIGMTWALFVAGVPTLIASQWQVPSESTTRLMVGFHKNLVGGSSDGKISKAEAWRQAVLVMINNPRYTMKPYYWAGFVVVGEGGN